MPKLVEAATGKLVDVPAEQVAQAFASGQYGFPKGQAVHVVGQDGTVGDIDPEQAQEHFASGGRLATDEEYKKAYLEHRYGGVGGSLAAAGEGAARGLSLGLSDPLAVGAARLFAGEGAARHVRQHLAEEKEAHPWLSTGAEIAGAAAPMLLSGGAGAAAEAETIGSLAQGIRTLGALPRGVGLLGDAAEHAAARVLGATAETALGRAGQAAAKTAARAIAEGGLFGAGSAVSESGLQDHELTAEKLFSAVGHSALTAGLLGGALSGAGSAAGSALSRVSGGEFAGKLDDAAGEQAWKWLSPRAAESREAARRAGGTGAVGKTVLDEILKSLIDQGGMSAAAISAPEKLAAIQAAVDRKGKAIGELLAGNADATVPLSELVKPIDDAMHEMRGKVLGEEKVGQLERLRESVVKLLGGDGEAAAGSLADRVPRAPADIPEYLRTHPEAQAELAQTGTLPDAAAYHLPEAAAPRAIEDIQVPIADAITQRRALQQLAYKESKALDPNLRVEMLRDVSGAWNDVEEKALNRFSSSLEDTGVGTQLRGLNKDFQRLKIAESAAEKTTAAYGANATFSLGDKIFGAAHLTGALASGHPVAAAGSLATMYGHKWLRNHGNAYAAVLLDKLASFGGMSRAAADVDAQVDTAVESLLSAKRATRRVPRVFKTSSPDDRFDEESSRVRSLAQVAPPILAAHLSQQTAGLETHAPQVAAAIHQQTAAATAFLQSKLPPTPEPDPLNPKAEPAYAPGDKTRFVRYVDAVEGGPPAILKRLAQGTQTQEDLETLGALYPKMAAEVRTKVLSRAATRSGPLPYQKRLGLASVVGSSADQTLDQAFLMSMQQSYASGAHAATSQAPTRGRGQQRQPSFRAVESIRMPDLVAGTFDAVERGHR